MDENKISDVRTSYDLVADEYVRHIYDELQQKPLDRALLDRFATRATGLVCDIGTGPGHVARYLHDRGAKVCGIDLAPEMVERARRLNPGIEFRQGDMFALKIADETFAGMTAFYALVNIPPSEIIRALRELRRVLTPGVCSSSRSTLAITFSMWMSGGVRRYHSISTFSAPMKWRRTSQRLALRLRKAPSAIRTRRLSSKTSGPTFSRGNPRNKPNCSRLRNAPSGHYFRR